MARSGKLGNFSGECGWGPCSDGGRGTGRAGEVRTHQLVPRVPGGEVLVRVEADAVRGQPGDEVRVTDGPFNNFTGSVEEVKLEKQKVRVKLSIFGRSTPVELDFNQVEKKRA